MRKIISLIIGLVLVAGFYYLVSNTGSLDKTYRERDQLIVSEYKRLKIDYVQMKINHQQYFEKIKELSKKEDDLLNRWGFAREIYTIASRTPLDWSVRIGIYGSWGEGKTAIALRLALTLAEAERARVVVVEGHVARPQLAAQLQLHLPDDLGLTMQLRRRMNGHGGAWNIVRIGASVFAIIEPSPTNVFPETLHSLWFPALIHELKAAYDYVLIDGCAVLEAIVDAVACRFNADQAHTFIRDERMKQANRI